MLSDIFSEAVRWVFITKNPHAKEATNLDSTVTLSSSLEQIH